MQAVNARKLTQTRAVSGLVIVAMIAQPMLASAPAFAHEGETATPIKHVIVIIGENRTFDHIFGGFQWRGRECEFLRRGLDCAGLLQRTAGRRAVPQVSRRHLLDE